MHSREYPFDVVICMNKRVDVQSSSNCMCEGSFLTNDYRSVFVIIFCAQLVVSRSLPQGSGPLTKVCFLLATFLLSKLPHTHWKTSAHCHCKVNAVRFATRKSFHDLTLRLPCLSQNPTLEGPSQPIVCRHSAVFRPAASRTQIFCSTLCRTRVKEEPFTCSWCIGDRKKHASQVSPFL